MDVPTEASNCVFLDVEDELLLEGCPGEQRSPSHQMQAVASWISHKVDSLVENDIILKIVVIPGKTPRKRAGERIVAPSQRAEKRNG